jgi:TOTE conflict system, Archaeo-Eukaryotic Primase domain
MTRTTDYKIQLYESLFQGLRNVYGTYDPKTGKYRQEKRHVNWHTIYHHLKGDQPYGFYPLMKDRTRVAVADFDDGDPDPSVKAIQFVTSAERYNIPAYMERSKSKGYHVWVFFPEKGIIARKARIVMRLILEDIEMPKTEVFPKQDAIDPSQFYGNFINAPLFGRLVPEGKTVFVKADETLEPYPDQWAVLEKAQRVPEELLDEIIRDNELEQKTNCKPKATTKSGNWNIPKYGLPQCIQAILDQGVTANQRVSCFRLAVHLKRVGIPHDLTINMLMEWRERNKPIENKGIITQQEIEKLTKDAYEKNYTGFGCQEDAIRSFCHAECQMNIETYSGRGRR